MEQQQHLSSSSDSSEQESASHLFDGIYDTSAYEKNMKNARTWLYIIAGFQFAMGIFEYNTTPDATVALIAFGIDAFIAVVFLGLGLWSRKKPVPAFTAAFAIYILILIGFALLDIASLYKGVVVKILVIIALVKANRDARKFEEARASLGSST